MRFYEVFIADGSYHSSSPLTYSFETPLDPLNVVSVPLRKRLVTGFIWREVGLPNFTAKPIKSFVSDRPLPPHSIELAKWLSEYYGCSLGDALRQFAPSRPSARTAKLDPETMAVDAAQLELDVPLTLDQQRAIDAIRKSINTTTLLHGDTGSGKTRLYIELARETLAANKSVILLTPEIALTTQLAAAVEKKLHAQTIVLHSQLTIAQRKKIWRQILEAAEPVVIIGPRSALFSPVKNLGLIIVDEAHEPAYKQDQSPRYHAVRIASQLGVITGAKVILGSATPSITDYYLANERGAVVSMKNQAITGTKSQVVGEIVDIKDKQNFTTDPYLSSQMLDAIRQTLSAKKQVMIYLNRRGTARLIMCNKCGWQMLCPHCHIPLVYHGDSHSARCHICGHAESPPMACPQCANPDVLYKTIGTKALVENVKRLFPDYSIARFDSDNEVGERVNELYPDLKSGKIDIIVGTQLLAKGFDLPKLGLVGIVTAETSLTLPDFASEERTFQLLYQVIGRVGRGHNEGKVIVQSYDPKSVILQSAIKRDWLAFYEYALKDRQDYRFPPFSYLMQLVCRRATLKGTQNAANNLRRNLLAEGLPVEIIGPAPSFYERRGSHYYWQLVVKSKNRHDLIQLAKKVPAGWMVDLDPIDLL